MKKEERKKRKERKGKEKKKRKDQRKQLKNLPLVINFVAREDRDLARAIQRRPASGNLSHVFSRNRSFRKKIRKGFSFDHGPPRQKEEEDVEE